MTNPKRRAAAADPELQRRIEAKKDQLLIAFLNRLGGSLEIPVEEVDGSDAFALLMGADEDARTFTFRVERKER
ncbi:hypothetical protein MKK88_13200 [Methylobacterium sp. E-005]|uniref:hypothetical protein n=1 Tax=Methylobacterium sp. E-005 TaxID=2836549 RepID=UPI001FBB37A4|nr:hypothetical protein [Methylobacterium sp. E-005]MCJ2086938.1 hypothetical protein [Methylobacterium sp. E-005]